MGHGLGPSRSRPRDLFHQPGEVDLDAQQQAAAETGFSTNVEYLYIARQPGVQQRRNTPSWFSNTGKSDVLTLQAYDGRITPANGIDPKALQRH